MKQAKLVETTNKTLRTLDRFSFKPLTNKNNDFVNARDLMEKNRETVNLENISNDARDNCENDGGEMNQITEVETNETINEVQINKTKNSLEKELFKVKNLFIILTSNIQEIIPEITLTNEDNELRTEPLINFKKPTVQTILRPQQILNFNLKKLLINTKKYYAKFRINKKNDELKIEQSNDMTDENQPEQQAEQHLSLMLRYFK